MCRFILNLRQLRPAGSSFIDGRQSVSLRFMGDMGEPLHFGGEEDNGDLDGTSHAGNALNVIVGSLIDPEVADDGQRIIGESVSLALVNYNLQGLMMYYVGIRV